MSDDEALEILRGEGHAAGQPDFHSGRVRVWVAHTSSVIDVQLGMELRELAQGKLSFEEIRERRERDILIRL
jgi:hypothetical protein